MIHYPQINPIFYQIGPVQIHWYGIMYLLGILIAWLLGRYRIKKHHQLNNIQWNDMIFYACIGMILGGRLGYILFYQSLFYFENPIQILAIHKGGMSFHGGFLGVGLALLYYSRIHKLSFLKLTDFITPLIPLAIGLGRLGNFINGELWGRITTIPWAMMFPDDPKQALRHPSQLYEMFFEGIFLFITLWIFSARKKPTGSVSAFFILGYALSRFFIEFYREPDSHLGLIYYSLTQGQLLTIPMIGFGVLLLYYSYKQKLKLIDN
ncbi:MAG: prolipoprotein diacylglyceryl transferase [Endozoicomonadaceae bacterium]|nr:prolipoprotein diacylglyceryl transferase [Endozoicomonadaceae bacterium]